MNKVIGLIQYVFASFGPLIVFYGVNHFFGLKLAVLSSVVWTMGEIGLHRLRKKPLDSFFKFSAAITLAFGLVDLYLAKSFLFKYEAALSNVMVGAFFFASLFGEKPIIQKFAEAQGRISGEISPDGLYFFKFMTVIWSLYSFVKAGAYIYMAQRFTLEQGLALRLIIGNVSFYALLFVSIFGARRICSLLAKARMLPSSRKPQLALR